MFNWRYKGLLAPERWKKTASITQYNDESTELENRDILGRYSAALYGYQDQLNVAVGVNTTYEELGFESFEQEGEIGVSGNLDFYVSSSSTQDTPLTIYRNSKVLWANHHHIVVDKVQLMNNPQNIKLKGIYTETDFRLIIQRQAISH